METETEGTRPIDHLRKSPLAGVGASGGRPIDERDILKARDHEARRLDEGRLMGAQTACSRMSVQELCYSRARELRSQAEQLEALAGALPSALATLSPQADWLLWDLLMAVGRR